MRLQSDCLRAREKSESGDKHGVARLNREIALGNIRLMPALHRAEQNARQLRRAGVVIQRHAAERLRAVRAKFHHFHQPARERLNRHGEGQAQNAADFPRRGALGIDHVVDGQLLRKRRQAAQIFRIANARDGVLRAQPLRRQTGEHVGFVAHRGSNDDVGVLHVRLGERVKADAAALHGHHVQRVQTVLQHRLAAVDHRYVVPLRNQPVRKLHAHLAAADHDNLHVSVPPLSIDTCLSYHIFSKKQV